MQNKTTIQTIKVTASTPIEEIQQLAQGAQASFCASTTVAQAAVIPLGVDIMICAGTKLAVIQALPKKSSIILMKNSTPKQAAALGKDMRITIGGWTPVSVIAALPIGAACFLDESTTKWQAAALPEDATVLIHSRTPNEAIAALPHHIAHASLCPGITDAQVRAIPDGVKKRVIAAISTSIKKLIIPEETLVGALVDIYEKLAETEVYDTPSPFFMEKKQMEEAATTGLKRAGLFPSEDPIKRNKTSDVNIDDDCVHALIALGSAHQA